MQSMFKFGNHFIGGISLMYIKSMNTYSLLIIYKVFKDYLLHERYSIVNFFPCSTAGWLNGFTSKRVHVVIVSKIL